MSMQIDMAAVLMARLGDIGGGIFLNDYRYMYQLCMVFAAVSTLVPHVSPFLHL
jgi:hypothetical protein